MKLPELLGRVPRSELRELLNSMVEDVVWHLNSMAVVGGNTRAAVGTIRAMEDQLHTIQVVAHLNINHVTIRDVVVHALEGVECRSHPMAGIGEGVLDVTFLTGHQEQFPSCTKPRMSNIKPRWFHHPHQELAHPLSLCQR